MTDNICTYTEWAATVAVRNVSTYGPKETGPSIWQKRKEEKCQIYLMSSANQLRLHKQKGCFETQQLKNPKLTIHQQINLSKDFRIFRLYMDGLVCYFILIVLCIILWNVQSFKHFNIFKKLRHWANEKTQRLLCPLVCLLVAHLRTAKSVFKLDIGL